LKLAHRYITKHARELYVATLSNLKALLKGMQRMSQRPRFLTTVDWRPYIDGAEDNIRDETLRCMLQYGIPNVRGWRYIDNDLSEAQCEEAFGLICEKYDLCRHCGKHGHDEAHCFEMWRAAAWCSIKSAAAPKSTETLQRAATA
jgi:hypothetical protein